MALLQQRQPPTPMRGRRLLCCSDTPSSDGHVRRPDIGGRDGRSVGRDRPDLLVHAVAAPITFTIVSWNYFRRRGHHAAADGYHVRVLGILMDFLVPW